VVPTRDEVFTPTDAASPVGKQPTEPSPVGCASDPLQVEWEADGFYITAMPEEWRGVFGETHGDIDVRSVVCPGWNNPYLWLRGEDRDADNDFVPAPEYDRPRVMAAIASVNAKHRKATPGQPVSSADELEPATVTRSESDGTKALRLVARLAKEISMEYPDDTESHRNFSLIASEARGGAG
jgi:hypothetical protein